MTSVLVAPPGDRAGARRPTPARFANGLRDGLRGTPGGLRVALVLSVLAGIGFGLFGGQAFLTRADALADARSGAAQVVRVQGIRTDLMEADARSVDAFLAAVSGDELSAGQRAPYEYAVHRVFRQTALASREPRDAGGLAVANRWASQYVRLSEQAAGTRTEGQVEQASTMLREQVLPVLDGVHQAGTTRVGEAYGRSQGATPLLLAAGIAAIVLLLGVQLWLAARTHRLLNLPLVAGLLGVLAVLLTGTLAMQWAQSRADAVRAGSYAATEAVVRARVAAFDARSAEGRSLIGSDRAGQEEHWQTAATEVRGALALAGTLVHGDDAALVTSARQKFESYAARHAEIAARADLDAARKQAISPAPTGGLGSFEDVENVTAQLLSVQERMISDGLAAPHRVLVGGAWLGLLCGLAAAALGLAGVGRRLAEYR